MALSYFEDFEVGHLEESGEIAVDGGEMVAYAKANDPWPIHTDDAVAAASPFGEVIASFGYVVSLFLRASHQLPMNQGSQEGFLGALEWKVQFRGAVRAGDRLRIRTTILSKRPTSKGSRGLITWYSELLNQNGEPAIAIEAVTLFLTRPLAQSGDH